MADDCASFDVLVKGAKVGEAVNNNTVVINTDTECKTQLEKLKTELSLSEEEMKLVNRCVAVVSAKDGDDVEFGPAEILLLGELIKTHPSHTKEIMACANHLSESVDCEGDLPPNIYLEAASAHAALGELLNVALAAGSIVNYHGEEDDFEEELSDEE